MWTTVAMAALTMTPAQPGSELKLSNARVTFGDLGPARPMPAKYLPGDFFWLLFDIENLKTNDAGMVNYTISMEVFDAAGKSLVKQKPVEGNELISLGGTKLPARAFLFLGVDQAAGKYQCKLSVEDKIAKTTQTLTQDFEVLPKKFGIVGFTAASDSNGEAPSPLFGTVGQAVWLQFFVTGFEREAKMKQPDLQILITIKDDTGKPVSKPQELLVNKGVMPTDSSVPVGFRIGFSREGKFKVEIKATDKLKPGTADTMEFPLEVIASPYKK